MICQEQQGISIHALLAESDSTSEVSDRVPLAISIHALLAESDQCKLKLSKCTPYFYPRSPCGERRDVIAVMTDAQSISIHALLAESDTDAINGCNPDYISIHALLAESDPSSTRKLTNLMISIHALLAESDQFPTPKPPRVFRFLSTLSLRRATALRQL